MTREPKKGEWMMRDGTFVRIRKMEDGHLLNTIAMLERNAPRYALAMAMSAGHYASQHDSMGGEAAEEASGQLLDIAFGGSPEDAAEEMYPKYTELVAEMERRGLKRKEGK